MHECKSFLPQIKSSSKILILGSMPGIKSLEMQQYYAHPQNRFWKVMGYLCNEKNFQNYSYDNRIKILLKNYFALWDVMKFCEREGSLDSNIKNEIPNEIENLLYKYKNIKTICLNGNKAYYAFKKFFPRLFEEYSCIKLPSTSPANAKFSLDSLIKHWELILNF